MFCVVGVSVVVVVVVVVDGVADGADGAVNVGAEDELIVGGSVD